MNTQTLYAKLSIVPSAIKDWLGSDGVLNVIEKIPHQFNLPEDASSTVSKLIQKLETKDIQAEYFAGELSIELNLDKNKAVLITEEIEKNIFAPIKSELKEYGVDLVQLEKFNLPIVKLGAPKIGAEVMPEGPAPKMVFGVISGNESVLAPSPLSTSTSKPISPGPTPIAPSAPKPSSSAVAAPSSSPKPISAVLSSIPPSASSSSSTTKIPSPMEGKFAPFVPAQPQGASSLSQAGWSKTTTPTATGSSSDPAPVMLHQDAKFSSSQKTTDFHLARPGGGAEVSLEGVKSQQTVKPAVLELGSLANAPAKPAAAPAPKFTHYSQFQVSTQPINRQVTEITSAMPKAASPAPVVSATPVIPATLVQQTPSMPKPIATVPVPQPPKPSTSSASSSALPPPPMPPKPPVVKNYP